MAGLRPVLIPEAFRSESSRGQVERGALTPDPFTHLLEEGREEGAEIAWLLFCHMLLSREMTLTSIILAELSDGKP